jgi:DNA polymerase-3 subunit delta'
VNSFQDFIGNQTTVDHLRTAVATGRLPNALILAGPQGAGKYTLALMLAKAVNCKNQPREAAENGNELASFCGHCINCTRIEESQDLQLKIDEALETREAMREVDKKETRILIQTHPDVLVIPPDPPQLLIKLGQVRSLMQSIYYRPAEGERKLYIFTSTAFMKEAANALLKVLEEPPAYAHIVILAENPGELLPTIRSRCGIARLGAIPAAEIEAELAKRNTTLRPAQLSLVARLAQGGIGRALSFDLDTYLAGRADALIFIQNAVNDPDHTALFKITETYRAGADGAHKTTALLRALSSLLEDMLLIQSGAPQLIRNVDMAANLEKLASALTFKWLEQASRALDQVESGMRRNLLRSLSLDAFAAQLAAR